MRWLLLILGVAILARVGYYVAFERVPAVPTEISARIRELNKGATIPDRCIAAQWLGKNGGVYAVAPLSKALKDPNLALRQNAAWALGQLGPKAISATPLLVAALEKDDDPGLRKLAAEALVAMGPDTSTEILAALRNRNSKVRTAMINGLRASPHDAKPLLPALIAMLDETEIEVRTTAALALAALGPDAADALPALDRAIATPNEASNEVFNAFFTIGPASIPVVTAALASSHPYVRRMALSTLSEFGTQAAPAWPKVIELLADSDATVRNAAILAASKIVENPADLAPRLVTAMDDADANVRRSAALAVGALGPPGAPGVPKLLEALRAANPDDQWELVEAIGNIGPPAIAAAPTLVEFVSAKDSPLFSPAVEALGRIGPDAKEALPPMLAALEASLAPTDESEPVFVDVMLVDAIGKVGANNAAQVAPVMLRALAKTDEATRPATLEALANLNQPGDEVIGALIEHLKAKEYEVAAAAAAALGRCGKGSPLALPALLAALETDSYSSRRAPIIRALAEFGPDAKSAAPVLLEPFEKSMNWGDEERVAAAHALAAIDPTSPKACGILINEALQPFGDAEIRLAAVVALAKFAPHFPEAVSTLQQLERGAPSPVRDAAAKALQSAPPADPSVAAP